MAKLNIRNCVRCKKIFLPSSGEKICPDCRAEDAAIEEKVKAYVRDHRGLTVNQLIEGSGVNPKIIWRMIQQGLFENSGLIDAEYPCANCGKPITKDLYCTECAGKFKENAQKFAAALVSKRAAADKKSQTFSNSMHDMMNNSR